MYVGREIYAPPFILCKLYHLLRMLFSHCQGVISFVVSLCRVG